MLKPRAASHWRIPLVRELAAILAIKLAILMTIKMVWFTDPMMPVNGNEKVSERLLGTTGANSQPLHVDEESPK